MHTDHSKYMKFTGKARFESSVNSLIGLIEGIVVDASINPQEIGFLKDWVEGHWSVQSSHPFNELIPIVNQALEDGVLTGEEQNDILWLCEKLVSEDYFNHVTVELQRLHAVLAGIAADGIISEDELRGLSTWLSEHDHLKTCWPYDEVCSLITVALADQRIDEIEHKMLFDYFSDFGHRLDDRTITNPPILIGSNIVGLCAVCPEIRFRDAIFCFTGASYRYTREQFSEIVRGLGGTVSQSVTRKLNYLIIGADGNPCWAYACYGRKVEKAVSLRKEGLGIVIVHENDFHDAVADLT